VIQEAFFSVGLNILIDLQLVVVDVRPHLGLGNATLKK
jgi:hypothetical protein